jgi:hypothetical protein
MVHVSVNVNHQGARVAPDYLKTLTEKYVRLPKLLDFHFRFSVDSVATVPERSVHRFNLFPAEHG